MRPNTADITASSSSSSTNLFEPNNLNEEDAQFLLRALEKQAFEYVLYAFRAQGPLTQYKELLIEHLKSALFVTDEEVTLQMRIAANNPYLNEIVQKLNPSYDNFSDWFAAGLDLTGIELASARRQRSENSNSQFANQTSKIRREIRRHNRSLCREREAVDEALADLYRLPKQPFVPERLRKLLQATEVDRGAESRIDIPKSSVVSDIATLEKEKQKPPVKKGNVGRPRKYPKPETVGPPEKRALQQQAISSLPCRGREETNGESNIGNRRKTSIATSSANNSTNTTTKRSAKFRDSKEAAEAAAAEEKAVLEILARSSAAILASEEAAKTKNEALRPNSFVAVEEQKLFPSTSTTAMEILADLALSQIANIVGVHSNMSHPRCRSPSSRRSPCRVNDAAGRHVSTNHVTPTMSQHVISHANHVARPPFRKN